MTIDSGSNWKTKIPSLSVRSDKRTEKSQTMVYQFKIYLKGVKPPIWRRIQISSEASLWDLHWAILGSIGWPSYHEFHLPIMLVPLEYDDVPYEGNIVEEPTRPGLKMPIRDFFRDTRAEIQYIYDFDDGWVHVVKLEKTIPEECGVTYPRCIAGRRRCPHENCFGAKHYTNMLKVISDPSHPEYDAWKSCLGGSFDSEEFSVDKVTFEDSKELLKIYLEGHRDK